MSSPPLAVVLSAGRTPMASCGCKAAAGMNVARQAAIKAGGPAVRAALERACLQASEIALFELDEAFAAQWIAVVRELGLSPDIVIVHGGAIALGHPIGASGARVLTTLIPALAGRDGGRGVASLCVGGGMGIAMVIGV